MTKEFRHKMIFLQILILKVGGTEHKCYTGDAKDLYYTSNDLLTL